VIESIANKIVHLAQQQTRKKAKRKAMKPTTKKTDTTIRNMPQTNHPMEMSTACTR